MIYKFPAKEQTISSSGVRIEVKDYKADIDENNRAEVVLAEYAGGTPEPVAKKKAAPKTKPLKDKA